MSLTANVLAVIGYPVAIVCIARLLPMFRNRWTNWFIAHELGTAAIVASWVLRGNRPATAINSAWLVGVGLAWVIAGRRRPRTPLAGGPTANVRD